MNCVLVIGSHRTDSDQKISPFNELFLQKISFRNNVTVLYPRNFSFRRKLFKKYSFGNYDVIEASCFYKPSQLNSSFLLAANRLLSFAVFVYLTSIKRISFNVVHQIGYFTEVGVNIARIRKCKLILQIIGSDIGNAAYARKLNLNKVVITANCRYALDFFDAPRKTAIYRGLDVHNPLYNLTPEGSHGELNLLYAGGFPEKRNHEIEGVENFDYKGGLSLLKVLSGKRGYKLNLAGPNIDAVRHRYEEMFLKGNVIVHNYLTHDWLLAVMNESDVVIIPSYSEGISNVAMEAMMLGKIVVSRRVGGMGELIRHQYSGLLFDTNEELATILDHLIERKGKGLLEADIQYLGTNAQETIKQQFDNTLMIDKYDNLYNEHEAVL